MPANVRTTVNLTDLRRFVDQNEPGPQSDLHLAWQALKNLTRYGPGERVEIAISWATEAERTNPGD